MLNRSLLSAASLLLLAACGGSPGPGPETPEQTAGDSGEPAASEEPTESTDEGEGAEATEPGEESSPTPEEPAGPSGGLTPLSVVGAESARFVLNFNASDPGIKAAERCDSQTNGDLRLRNQCMAKARTTVKEDVMQFKTGDSGRLVWTTSTQRGSTLVQLRQTNFTWGPETKNSVEIQPSKGPKVVISVPNNYSIAIEHDEHGKLVYDSKRSE